MQMLTLDFINNLEMQCSAKERSSPERAAARSKMIPKRTQATSEGSTMRMASPLAAVNPKLAARGSKDFNKLNFHYIIDSIWP